MAEIAVAPVTFRPVDAPKVVSLSRATLYRWAKEGHIRLYLRAGMTFAVTTEVVDYITGAGGSDGGEGHYAPAPIQRFQIVS